MWHNDRKFWNMDDNSNKTKTDITLPQKTNEKQTVTQVNNSGATTYGTISLPPHNTFRR